jgi:hypothetical protein
MFPISTKRPQVLVQGLVGIDRYMQRADASPPNRLKSPEMDGDVVGTAMWSGWPVCPLPKRQGR